MRAKFAAIILLMLCALPARAQSVTLAAASVTGKKITANGTFNDGGKANKSILMQIKIGTTWTDIPKAATQVLTANTWSVITDDVTVVAGSYQVRAKYTTSDGCNDIVVYSGEKTVAFLMNCGAGCPPCGP